MNFSIGISDALNYCVCAIVPILKQQKKGSVIYTSSYALLTFASGLTTEQAFHGFELISNLNQPWIQRTDLVVEVPRIL